MRIRKATPVLGFVTFCIALILYMWTPIWEDHRSTGTADAPAGLSDDGLAVDPQRATRHEGRDSGQEQTRQPVETASQRESVPGQALSNEERTKGHSPNRKGAEPSGRLCDVAPNAGPLALLKALNVELEAPVQSKPTSRLVQSDDSPLSFELKDGRLVKLDEETGHLTGYMDRQESHVSGDSKRLQRFQAAQVIKGIVDAIDLETIAGGSSFEWNEDDLRNRDAPGHAGGPDAALWSLDALFQYQGEFVPAGVHVSVCATTGEVRLFRLAPFIPPPRLDPAVSEDEAAVLAGEFLRARSREGTADALAERERELISVPANNFWTREPGQKLEFERESRRAWEVTYGPGLGLQVYVDAETGDIIGGMR